MTTMKKDDAIDAALRELPQWQPPQAFAARVAAAAVVADGVAPARARGRHGAGLPLLLLALDRAVMLVIGMLLGAWLAPSRESLALVAQHALTLVTGLTWVLAAVSMGASWWLSRRALARLFAGAHLARPR